MRRHFGGYTPRARRDARPRFCPAVIGAIVFLSQCVYTAAIDCPPNSVLQPDGDCACDAGYEGDPADTMIRCGGTCGCDGWTTAGGVITDGAGSYRALDSCWWIISGSEPTVTFTHFETDVGYDFVYVDSCTNAACTEGVVNIAEHSGILVTLGSSITETTNEKYMRVWFISDRLIHKAGFSATWNRGSPLQCIACNPGKYKAMVGPTDCVDCAAISKSGFGSAECQCKAGYTGETVATPVVRCGGDCGCGLVAWGESISSGKHVADADCWWLISGLIPTITFTTFDRPPYGGNEVTIMSCADAKCSQSPDVVDVLLGKPAMPRTFETTCATGSKSDGTCVHKPYMKVFLTTDTFTDVTRGFTATWSADVCSSCGLSEYRDEEGAQYCSPCPENTEVAVSGGGTNINQCKCIDGTSAGHSDGGIPCFGTCDEGYEPSGTDCLQCTSGTFKSAHGTGSCLPCPTNAVSEIGSSQCLCVDGFHHPIPV